VDEECEREVEQEEEEEREQEIECAVEKPRAAFDWDYDLVSRGDWDQVLIGSRSIKLSEFIAQSLSPIELQLIDWGSREGVVYLTENFRNAIEKHNGFKLNDYLRRIDSCLYFTKSCGILLISDSEANKIVENVWNLSAQSLSSFSRKVQLLQFYIVRKLLVFTPISSGKAQSSSYVKYNESSAVSRTSSSLYPPIRLTTPDVIKLPLDLITLIMLFDGSCMFGPRLVPLLTQRLKIPLMREAALVFCRIHGLSTRLFMSDLEKVCQAEGKSV
jgi:hypothetical protein